MSNSLYAGVSGLTAHQQMLDVVSNNIANLNTTGYKTRRVTFADLMYTTLRPAVNSANGNIGGTNPNEIGSGVKAAAITPMFAQGNLEQTSEPFDMAIQGDGFFVVNDGTQELYTRDGTFALDESGRLVDSATGFRVQRFGAIGETDPSGPGFQTPGDKSINIPLGASIPGENTTELTLRGNLDAAAQGPTEEVLSTVVPFTTGGAAALETTLLNSLDQTTTAYAAGDVISIKGTAVDGSPVDTSYSVDGTTTLGDLADAVSSAFSGASAAVDNNGNLMLTADDTGEAFLSLTLEDSPANAGNIDFSRHVFLVTTDGTEGAAFESSVEVIDTRGGSHSVGLTFSKTGDDVWQLDASLAPNDGDVISGNVSGISFSQDGSLLAFPPNAQLVFQFDGIDQPQPVTLSLGTIGAVDGLSQLASDSKLAVAQDGFSTGVLTSVHVTKEGVLEGLASNGKRTPLAQLAIASFVNPHGLESRGDNYFEQAPSSGNVQIGTALSSGRGAVLGGQLEASNVDIALEFTRLIVAQRGFSANARSVTVSGEILEELTNVIR